MNSFKQQAGFHILCKQRGPLCADAIMWHDFSTFLLALRIKSQPWEIAV